MLARLLTRPGIPPFGQPFGMITLALEVTGATGFVFHFNPTPSFWLNAVEGYLMKLTRRSLKSGIFRFIVFYPQTGINRLLADTNNQAKP